MSDTAAPTQPPFRLELEQTFGAEEDPPEAILSFVTGAAVDDRGNVYVVDRSENRLVAFRSDGSFLWEAGRSGQGPGEFDSPNAIAWDGGDRLYVDNNNGRQVEIWSLDGEHVGSRSLAPFDFAQGYVVGLIDRETIVLRSWARTKGDGAQIHVFDMSRDEWTLSSTFFGVGGRVAEGEDEQRYWGTVEVALDGDTIWVGNQMRYEARRYDLDGTLLRVIARDGPDLPPPLVYKGTGTAFGAFEPPRRLPDGTALLPRFHRTAVADHEEFRRLWDVYFATGERPAELEAYATSYDLIDAEGRILATLSVDGAPWETIGLAEVIGPDGKLYARVTEPFPHVRRYRVHYPTDES